MESKLGIYIGRFQPFHEGHLEVVEHMMKQFDDVLIVIGSSYQARDSKNPFTHAERASLINQCVFSGKNPTFPLIFMSVRDNPSDKIWEQQIIFQINSQFPDYEKTLMCPRKDSATSEYLDMFDYCGWNKEEYEISHSISATDIRDDWFNSAVIHNVLPQVGTFIKTWEEENPLEYDILRHDYQYIQKSKDMWKNSPYPPIFTTADCIVHDDENVLLIQRAYGTYGAGLYAIPGGYVEENESIKKSAVRELFEETGIKIHENTISYLGYEDCPWRSLRGRIITHVFEAQVEKLVISETKHLQNETEVAKLILMNKIDIVLSPEKFFEDHYHILMKHLEL